MKKILYVATLSRTINAFLIPHIKMLIDEGNIVDCACSIDNKLDITLSQRGVKVYDVPFNRNPLHLNNIKALRMIMKIQSENSYDVVHVHTPIASFITRFSLRKRKSIKMIYTAHGLHFYKGAPMINWILYYPLEKIAAHWTNTLVTINSEDLEIVKKFTLRDKGIAKMIYGVGLEKKDYLLKDFDKDGYKISLGLDKEDFILLILAEINNNKNHLQIINAMKILIKKHPNIKVLCAGDGKLINKLQRKVSRFKLGGNVIFLGFRKDVKELLNICDCVGLFSKREGLGKCLLEGMVVQKPLIATRTRGAKELIDEGENGYLIDLNDYKDTALKLEKLYQSMELRENFGKYSKNKLNNYLVENVLEEIKKIY